MMKGLGETVWDDEGAMVRQFGIMNGLGGTVLDDEGAMVRVWAYERAMV